MARARWRQWTERQGRAAVEGLARSGLNANAFSRREGISRGRLTYWKERLGESTTPAFVALPMPAGRRGQIEIAHGEIVVRVREDLESEHLGRIFVALLGRSREC